MTDLLQIAFSEAAKLSAAEQDLLASWLLAELEGPREDDFDAAISNSAPKLAGMSTGAIAEHRAGQTEELNPEQL